MKLKDILLIVLSALILSNCAVIDPPSKLTEWRKTRPQGQVIVQHYDDDYFSQNN